MLESLHIANYALIDCIDIDFHSGLNIITGETGAGKSIMLGALSLILGGRADTKAVRQADRKSVIGHIADAHADHRGVGVFGFKLLHLAGYLAEEIRCRELKEVIVDVYHLVYILYICCYSCFGITRLGAGKLSGGNKCR